MSLDALKKLLDGHEKKDEALGLVVDLIGAETEKGKDSARKLRADLEKYSKYKKALEAVGFDGQADAVDFADTLKQRLEKGSSSSDEFKALKSQFDKLQNEYSSEKAQNRRNSLEKQVFEALTSDPQKKWIGNSANLITRSLIADGAVDLTESGTVVYKKGEAVEDFGGALPGIFEENKDFLANSQNPGAGGTPGTKDVSRVEEDRIKRAARDIAAAGF